METLEQKIFLRLHFLKEICSKNLTYFDMEMWNSTPVTLPLFSLLIEMATVLLSAGICQVTTDQVRSDHSRQSLKKLCHAICIILRSDRHFY